MGTLNRYILFQYLNQNAHWNGKNTLRSPSRRLDQHTTYRSMINRSFRSNIYINYRMDIPSYQVIYLENLAAICSAIAKHEVKPGDSIPKRLIRPGIPWASSPCINEITISHLTQHYTILKYLCSTHKKNRTKLDFTDYEYTGI